MSKATSIAAVVLFLGSSVCAQETAKPETVAKPAANGAPATTAAPATPSARAAPGTPATPATNSTPATPATKVAARESATTIDAAIRASSPEVQEFNEHLMVLASPWMEGRLPGTRGFERASQYMEDHFKEIGLVAPVEQKGAKTYRNPFNLGGTAEITGGGIKLKGTSGGVELVEGEDFTLTSLGTAKPIADAPLVFVGYGINDGPDGYQTFGEDDDLAGKVAVVFRFEPMDEKGGSKWAQRGWSGRSSFASKLGTLMKRKPAAIIVINPPGAADPRAKTLTRQSAKLVEVPVYMMSAEGADKLFKAADESGRDAMAMRGLVDSKGAVAPLPKATVTLEGRIETKPVETANIIGLLPGKGALKDEYIVIGGHLDHLGQGFFGSREGGGKLHPGADDNASGSAGVIMLAESLSDAYKKLPAGTEARSIVFMGFAAEESGLNGSEAYVANPVFPIEKTVLMFNFDMIGRIVNKRLSVSGTDTGEGMHDWVQPFLTPTACGLEVVQNKRTGPGGSDHTSFAMKNVPVLFAIIADIGTANPDYHTSKDTTDKINREDAVLAIKLWHEIALAAAQRPERFAFKGAPPAAGGGAGGGAGAGAAPARLAKVRFGVRTDDGEGVLRVMEVVKDASADLAGMQVGDVILRISKIDVKNRGELMERLLELNPDDTVQVVVKRDGQEIALEVKMQARK